MAQESTTTLTTAIGLLQSRLEDPSGVRYSSAECTRYLTEAFRTYQAFTGHHRDQGAFSPVPGTIFYSLPNLFPALRGMTVTDQDLVLQIENHLLEPENASVWTGSSQFTLDSIAGALTRRRDQFLLETASVLTWVPGVSFTTGRVTLPPSILSLRRVSDATGIPLRREDEWSLTGYLRSWRTGGTPRVYSVSATPPLVLQLAPSPSGSGTIDLVTVTAGPILSPSVGVSLGIPDDWAWVVKWGALSDLLSQDGLGADPARAQYSEARYRHGIELARDAPVCLTARVGNTPVRLNSFADADRYLVTWAARSGPVAQILIGGQNLLAVSPVPTGDDPTQTVTLDLVRNIPIPGPSEYLPIPDGDLDTVIDYAEHVALFKEGAGPLERSTVLYDRFARLCGIRTGLEKARTRNKPALDGQTGEDQRADPHQAPPDAPVPIRGGGGGG